jgi:hypothetical protein
MNLSFAYNRLKENFYSIYQFLHFFGVDLSEYHTHLKLNITIAFFSSDDEEDDEQKSNVGIYGHL